MNVILDKRGMNNVSNVNDTALSSFPVQMGLWWGRSWIAVLAHEVTRANEAKSTESKANDGPRKSNALAGSRTRASRVAENSTTEPPMLP